jgi:hypothetical protein
MIYDGEIKRMGNEFLKRFSSTISVVKVKKGKKAIMIVGLIAFHMMFIKNSCDA